MSEIYGTGLTGLLKKFAHNLPGAAGSAIIGVLGFGVCCFSIYHLKHSPTIPKFKRDYIVVRPDDPMVTQPVRTFPEGNFFKQR